MATAAPDNLKQREPATLWRLVDAKCKQIGEAASAARLPILLALTWSFIWVSALYVAEYSYIQQYRDRLKKLSALMHPADGPAKPEFKELCRELYFGNDREYEFGGDKYRFDPNWQIEYCRKTISQRYEFAEKVVLEGSVVNLPWGIGRLHVSDFGIIGNAALILILSWSFFAMRRENQAVRSFVDFHDLTKPKWFWYPDPYILCPEAEYFSDEHYAYSYHAVSQTFTFMFSAHSWPLFMATLMLGSTPALVAILNAASNGNSLIKYYRLFEPSVFSRFYVEMVLVIVVLAITARIIKVMLDTSILLNGWNLAVGKVWMEAWDERTDDPASMVLIGISEQTAKQIDDPYAATRKASGKPRAELPSGEWPADWVP